MAQVVFQCAKLLLFMPALCSQKINDPPDTSLNNLTLTAKENDLYALYDSAKDLHDATLEALYNLSHLNSPDLDNEQAKQFLNNMQENFSNYIGALRDMSATVMNMANTGIADPESVRSIKDDAALYNQASVNLAVNILKTYNALGVTDIDKIDIKNGGLLSANPRRCI